ncbi:MAG: hypothetical protein BJ554DRAFT_5661, partial [Olpidium bornovanus]
MLRERHRKEEAEQSHMEELEQLRQELARKKAKAELEQARRIRAEAHSGSESGMELEGASATGREGRYVCPLTGRARPFVRAVASLVAVPLPR